MRRLTNLEMHSLMGLGMRRMASLEMRRTENLELRRLIHLPSSEVNMTVEGAKVTILAPGDDIIKSPRMKARVMMKSIDLSLLPIVLYHR